MADWGSLIKEAREAQGLNQEELAELVKVSRGTMGHIETNKVRIDSDVFTLLITALRGLRPVELLEAMGFPVTVPQSDRVPAAIVRAIAPLRPADLLVLERVALGLQREPASPRGRVER